jgi:hypothetical protein
MGGLALDHSFQFLPSFNTPSQQVLERYQKLKKSLKLDTYSILREK